MTSQIKVITPQYIDAPKEGKKLWQIKDAEGNRYGVLFHIAQGLQKDVAAKVEVTSREWQGKTYYNIEKVLPPDQETQAAQAAQPKPSPMVPDVLKQEMIFIAGVVNHGISSGQISPTDSTALLAAVTAARYAWGTSFGTNAPQAKQPHQAAAPFELNDEVPF